MCRLGDGLERESWPCPKKIDASLGSTGNGLAGNIEVMVGSLTLRVAVCVWECGGAGVTEGALVMDDLGIADDLDCALVKGVDT